MSGSRAGNSTLNGGGSARLYPGLCIEGYTGFVSSEAEPALARSYARPMFFGPSQRSGVMSRRKRFAQTLSLALLVAGMSVSVAQAKPFEPSRGVHPHVVSARTRAAVDTQGWTAALLSSDSSKAAKYAAAQASTPASSGSSTNWTAVGVWATIVVILIGALGVGMFRTRPRRPAAA
jgi:hypothetical protein